MTTDYLGVKQVAEYLGVTPEGLLNLRLPDPDVTIGRTRGWSLETIEEWNKTRPSHGGSHVNAMSVNSYVKTLEI